MTDLVFDAEPLIAYLYDEPGASEVRERLDAVEAGRLSASIAHATAAEVVYTVARLETGDPNRIAPSADELETGVRDLRVLQGYGVAVETPPWRGVASLKAGGRISLGDAYAAALAAAQDATLVVGNDPEFGAVAAEVELAPIRDEPS